MRELTEAMILKVFVIMRHEHESQGFAGASSHSGRRTFVTRRAKKIVEAGGSLRDVQELAGHASLATTRGYIQGDIAARLDGPRQFYVLAFQVSESLALAMATLLVTHVLVVLAQRFNKYGGLAIFRCRVLRARTSSIV
jgi:hypothetical protein